MVEVSQSTLFFSISLCVLVFTGYLVYIMYYLGQLTKQSNEMVTEFREKIAELEETIATIKNKLTTSAESVAFVAGEIKNVVDMVQDRKEKKKITRKKKK